MMQQHDALVAIYATHDGAEAAIRMVAENGLDMKHFSVIGRGYHADEPVVGFYGVGDRIKFWGARGAYWGGLWGLLFGGLMMTIPVIGPVVILGSVASLVFTALTAPADGAMLMGGLGALGAALVSIDIPHHSVLQYEAALKADRFLVVAHGPSVEIERARTLLAASGPTQIDVHANVTERGALAA